MKLSISGSSNFVGKNALNGTQKRPPTKLQPFKVRRKQGNIVAEAKMRPGRKKCFCKISEAFFAFKTQILCLQHMLRGGVNEESLGKH